MRCLKCTREVHARELCTSHYMEWYRAHPEEARRQGNTTRYPHHWKFTAEHWWSWWEKRTPDLRTLELRNNIEAMRHGLP